jgi:hypothetical protein
MGTLKQIKLNNFPDERGELTVMELKDYISWPVRRIYYLTDVKMDRGGHCVKGENKVYICQYGSVKARFFDGVKWEEFAMKGPNDAIVMEGDFYREFTDFSSDAVLLAVSSVNYNNDDYIYDIDEFVNYIKNK